MTAGTSEAGEEARETAPESYETLLEEYRRVANVREATGVLRWDQQVMMPEEGTPARSQQLSTLSSLSHDLLTDDNVGDALDALESESLTDEQAGVVREIRRQYDRAIAVPSELVEEISTTASEALPAWESAKAEDDFESFAPYLRKHVELKREYAEHIDPDRDPYEVLFEDFEPCLSLERAETILESMRETLVPMIEEIRESDVDLATDAFTALGTYPEAEQEALCRDALTTLGYPWERGRLDTASHPFSTGTTFDARVTAIASVVLGVISLTQVPLTILILTTMNEADAAISTELGRLVRNPVLLTLVAGLTVGSLGLSVPGPITAGLDVLGTLALPIALLCVGASLQIDLPNVDVAASGAVVAVKIVCMPVLGWIALSLLEVDAATFTASIVMLGTPTAVSTYVFASEIGGDEEFASLNVFLTTLASIATLFVLIRAVG